MSTLKDTVAAARRKLQALDAVTSDASATESERENAKVLRARLEQQLRAAGEPAGDWTDGFFRLGRLVKGLQKDTHPGSSNAGWTGGAFRLGRALRRGYKTWSSD